MGDVMATTDQLAALRRAADVSATDPTYTDGLIGTLIDTLGVNGAAAVIWREKAAKYATMVSMSEAGSSRNLSDMWQRAVDMQAMYERLADEEEQAEDPTNLTGYSYTIGIERV
jgi:hypothetical protein